MAQHTLLVDDVAVAAQPGISARERLAVMLHDAPEYVIGDLISPFKVLLGGEYRAVEARLLAAIHLRFGLPATLPEKLTARIKAADRVAAYHEAIRIAGFEHAEALRYFGRPTAVDPAKFDLTPWPAATAERRFLRRFRTIEAASQREA